VLLELDLDLGAPIVGTKARPSVAGRTSGSRTLDRLDFPSEQLLIEARQRRDVGRIEHRP
jgi:hypothetical protein